MAEFAIPLLALGGFYVISKHNNENENEQEGFSSQYEPDAIDETTGVTGETQHVSLTGDVIHPNEFKHNNMTPFYSGRGGGRTATDDIAEVRLDHMQGSGSQSISKREQAPLFKPSENTHHTHGMPSQTDFVQSRMNQSIRMSNIKPWQEERVAPGLNMGFTTKGGDGLNTGMESRELWGPKTVDELRVKTNPKNTYNLQGHEGPASYHNKFSGNVKTQGKVEKNRVDRDFELGPKRWFVTTGDTKAAKLRENVQISDTNRQHLTSDYYGNTTAEVDGSYTKRNYADSTKQQLAGSNLALPTATSQQEVADSEYGHQSYNLLSNNRTLDGEKNEFGHVMGMMRAVVAPFQDSFRPSRKELLIDNLRHSGNPVAEVANSAKRNNECAKPTIRQMTESEQYGKYLNYQGDQHKQGYLSSMPNPTSVQRDTTAVDYTGNASSGMHNLPQSYISAANQRNSTLKTIPNRPNPGGTQVFQHKINMETQKLESDRRNKREMLPNRGHHIIPTKQTQGIVYQPSVQREDDRMSSDLLTAFKSNPYTKSLHSF